MMKRKDSENQKVSSYIPRELHARLVSDAEQNKRSISGQVHHIIESYYKSQDQD